MRRVTASLCLIGVIAVLQGCSSDKTAVDSTPVSIAAQERTIALNTPTSFDSAGIVISFDSLVGFDNRTPDTLSLTDPGYAGAAFTVSGHPHPIVLTISGHYTSTKQNVFSMGTPVYIDGYRLELVDLLPYPDSYPPPPESLYSARVLATPYDTLIAPTQSLMSLQEGSYWTYAETTYTATDTIGTERTFRIVSSFTDAIGTWYVFNNRFLDLGSEVFVRDYSLYSRQSQGYHDSGGFDAFAIANYRSAADTAYTYDVILEGDLVHERTVCPVYVPMTVPAGTFDTTWRYQGPVFEYDYDVSIAPGIGVVSYSGVVARESPPRPKKTIRWWLLDHGVN